MTKKNSKQPKSIYEALGDRADLSDIPEPTEEEAIQDAMLDLQAQEMIPSQYPEMEQPQQKNSLEKKGFPIQENSPKQESPAETEPSQPGQMSMSNPPEKESQKILASSIDPQPVEETSPPESQEPPEKNPALRRMLDYIKSDLYTVDFVQMHLVNIMRNPAICPPSSIWDLPGDHDMSQPVYKVVTTPGYVESIWPVLEIILGNSIDNEIWVSGVITTMAFFDVLRSLPYWEK